MLEALFQPFACKSLKARNRFAMAPMTRYLSPGGILPPEAADYYGQRAEGGVGLIISEGAGLDNPASRSVDTVPVFCGEKSLANWQRACRAVQAAGAAMAPQLWHIGGSPDYNFPDAEHAPLISPSGLIGPEAPGGRTMTQADIDDTIASYARAAAQAQRLGFDAVELHGAHGYLFDQFFWGATNRRTDRYGGPDIADQARFATEVVQEIRRSVGPDFAIILRISQWKTAMYEAQVAADPGELERWLAPLSDAGVDIFHCSERRFWEPAFEGSDLNLAGWSRKVTGKPVISVGSVGLDRDLMADFSSGQSMPDPRSLERLAERFDRGEFDMIAVGRALLADSHWLEKARAGRWAEMVPYSVAAIGAAY
jgi:2,4-dienoyl-CoA reductase-like NADH-dependent reductase (Old Yellow Enzyme family)